MPSTAAMAYITLHEPLPVEEENAAWVRLVDGIGFRYRWATEGLRAEDENFKPGPDSMTTRQLMEHIDGLIGRVCQSFSVLSVAKLPATPTLEELRMHTLHQILELSVRLASLTEADMTIRTISGVSILYAINGPLADSLTHIGQLNAWRRLNGNPGPKVNLFLGKPEAPAEKKP